MPTCRAAPRTSDADGLRWRLYAALSDPALLREPALRPLRAYQHGGGLDGDSG